MFFFRMPTSLLFESHMLFEGRRLTNKPGKSVCGELIMISWNILGPLLDSSWVIKLAQNACNCMIMLHV